jgi:hypothetical protein
MTLRGGVALALGLLACADKGPPRQPWDQWAKPGGTEEQRTADYAECASQGKTWGIGFNVMAAHEMNESIYRECMEARGWRPSDEPGGPDREVPLNSGH